ncbi:uncharacterized protein SCHCODRAFT_01038487 [Schizophyllum commune H4-8]|uniref:uncharacterized protein n=1 Tax=Schizophyllum commune (strain H4-8 / FGSC 9210) TaxID=578458 RepID=UPI00216061A2|nr:uncharacterized protein SCHCODRAFT_01038487 [Schizophyllum commune H4-8]KAI5892841.1 hypothetical protein SCHCODRAFT_01038487 [Schizophyllum commune H4-8]
MFLLLIHLSARLFNILRPHLFIGLLLSPVHHPSPHRLFNIEFPTTLTTSASYFCIIYHISIPYIRLALGDTFRTYIVVGGFVFCAHHCLLYILSYRFPLVLHRRYRPIVVATSTTLTGDLGSSRPQPRPLALSLTHWHSALPTGTQPHPLALSLTLWHPALPSAAHSPLPPAPHLPSLSYPAPLPLNVAPLYRFVVLLLPIAVDAFWDFLLLPI